MNPALYASSSRPWPRPVRRAPLAPLPEPLVYDHVLPFTPPATRDLLYYRGNFCGIRVPGAPAVPGSNAANPECVMSCLLDNYPRAVQEQYLTQYAESGYTHLQRSIGHALAYGGTLASHVELSRRAQDDYGLFCDQWLLGVSELMPGNMALDFYRQYLDPWIDAMLGAGVVDLACVGWQLDQFMGDRPGNDTLALVAYVGTRLGTIPVFTHWVNEALAWWRTGGEEWSDDFQTINVHDRFSWWLACRPYLTGGHHQGDTMMARTNPRLYQDKMKDTLDAFNDGHMGVSWRNDQEPFLLTGYEMTAQDQFDGTGGRNPMCSEDEGDRVGYIMQCTMGKNNSHLGGYGNGARMPNGTRL